MIRLISLDYLRGFAAMAILLYHYFSWTFGQFDSSSLLGRVGIYGVSIFYLLSGLTFYSVYHGKFSPSIRWNAHFFVKRILRIFPLLWLATFLHIFLVKGPIDIEQLFLNVSGLFAFVSWDQYFATGAWSIGNELVFYALLPIIFWTARRGLRFFIPLLGLFFAIYLLFAFRFIDSGSVLSEQWHLYTNPLNQAFLFIGGYALGVLINRISLAVGWNVLIMLIGIGLFVWYPVEGNRLQLVCGIPRVVFTLSCLMIVWGVRSIQWNIPKVPHKALSWLGHISFSLYLLHPLVFEGTDQLFGKMLINTFGSSAGITFVLSIFFSILLSSISYLIIEKPVILLGRRIGSKRSMQLVKRKQFVLLNCTSWLGKRISSFRLW